VIGDFQVVILIWLSGTAMDAVHKSATQANRAERFSVMHTKWHGAIPFRMLVKTRGI
jgi:hypothetical protein